MTGVEEEEEERSWSIDAISSVILTIMMKMTSCCCVVNEELYLIYNKIYITIQLFPERESQKVELIAEWTE